MRLLDINEYLLEIDLIKRLFYGESFTDRTIKNCIDYYKNDYCTSIGANLYKIFALYTYISQMSSGKSSKKKLSSKPVILKKRSLESFDPTKFLVMVSDEKMKHKVFFCFFGHYYLKYGYEKTFSLFCSINDINKKLIPYGQYNRIADIIGEYILEIDNFENGNFKEVINKKKMKKLQVELTYSCIGDLHSRNSYGENTSFEKLLGLVFFYCGFDKTCEMLKDYREKILS